MEARRWHVYSSGPPFSWSKIRLLEGGRWVKVKSKLSSGFPPQEIATGKEKEAAKGLLRKPNAKARSAGTRRWLAKDLLANSRVIPFCGRRVGQPSKTARPATHKTSRALRGLGPQALDDPGAESLLRVSSRVFAAIFFLSGSGQG